MANSNYYYGLYTKYKKEAEDYAENIEDLKNIKNCLTSEFYDEQKSVNGEVDDLTEDLNKAVRYDYKFPYNAKECEKTKEKTSSADRNLSNVITAIENEMGSLEMKKKVAEQNRDSNYRQYESQKRAEMEQLAKILEF